MAKKNGKTRRERSDQSVPTTAPPDGGATTSEPRKRLTVPERLVAKSRHVRDSILDLHKMATFYGVPDEIVKATSNLLADADAWVGSVKEVVDGGWQPAVKSDLKELIPGDKIAINNEALASYAYIPSNVRLVAGTIERSSNGRIKRVLLLDERHSAEGIPEGAPSAYGWAQLSHLERR